MNCECGPQALAQGSESGEVNWLEVWAIVATFWAAAATVFAAMSHLDYVWWRDHANLWKRMSGQWQDLATRQMRARHDEWTTSDTTVATRGQR